jgi:hypothetical protein
MAKQERTMNGEHKEKEKGFNEMSATIRKNERKRNIGCLFAIGLTLVSISPLDRSTNFYGKVKTSF